MEGFSPFYHPVSGPQIKPALPAEGFLYEEFWGEGRFSLTGDAEDLLLVDIGGVSLNVVRAGTAGRGGQVLFTPDGDAGDNLLVGSQDLCMDPARNDRVYVVYFKGSIEDISESQVAIGFSGVRLDNSADPIDNFATANGAYMYTSAADGVFDWAVGDGTTVANGVGTGAALGDDEEFEATVLMWRNRRVEFWVNGVKIGQQLSPTLPAAASPFFQVETTTAAIDNGLYANSFAWSGYNPSPS